MHVLQQKFLYKIIQRLSKLSYCKMNFMGAKVYKHRTLPSFLEFSYVIASLIREYVREVENKQKVSEASK